MVLLLLWRSLHTFTINLQNKLYASLNLHKIKSNEDRIELSENEAEIH